ncbi:MAG: tyrosine-type recombinase/integrase [Solirubrobacterales bacterium]|nr:tyrosine-type recombinase/integrase [Solirubrobacterales bacterium]
MSYRLARSRFEVRWRDSSGRHRSRRFREEAAARAFDESIHDNDVGERVKSSRHGQSGGVYPYETTSGTRWRYVTRRSDGSQTTKRGFTSETAARTALRRITEKKERREIVHTKETFGAFFARWLSQRKPYLSEGTWRAYERDGRLRLLPALGTFQLGRMEVEHIRDLVDELAESMEAGEIAPKTINNTLGTLVVCLNAAVEDGLTASNPALRVPRLPPGDVERDYLRLREIGVYLDSCSSLYRPLAETLIGAGSRISETLALRRKDLELEAGGGVIILYSSKSGRFRHVEIGQGLSGVLRRHLERRSQAAGGDDPDALVFVMPVRRRKRDQGRWEGSGDGGAMDRTTVSRDWHKAALQDASLRNMPLHALRHTAAAAWLAGGNSLKYVKDQLGHAHITTTESYYGHLERSARVAGPVATEKAIARAMERAA